MGESVHAEDGRAAERGIKHPADSLRDAIEMLGRVKAAVGFSPASRQTLAEALGYRGISGASARKIGSLTHFKLMERMGSGAYRISDLGKQILTPTSDQELRHAIAEAAKQPALYAALIERYAGHAIPTLLPNVLIREHGIFAGSAESAAAAFRDSMEFAGLLQNGVLSAGLTTAGDAEVKSSDRAVSSDGPAQLNSATQQERGVSIEAAGADFQQYVIALGGGGRVATIRLPLPITLRDLKRLTAWAKYMEAVVKDEETPENSGS